MLAALVPVYYRGPDSKVVWGVTTAEHPTLWFYVPSVRPATGKFWLQDANGYPVYEAAVTLPETPGVVSISLPSTAPPLEIGKLYNWYFDVYCQGEGLAPSLSVNGSITRNSLNPALTSQLEQATPQQRIALYAANGIWYEALTAAAELRRTNPNAPEWAALLDAAWLDLLTTEPIVECCQIEWDE